MVDGRPERDVAHDCLFVGSVRSSKIEQDKMNEPPAPNMEFQSSKLTVRFVVSRAPRLVVTHPKATIEHARLHGNVDETCIRSNPTPGPSACR